MNAPWYNTERVAQPGSVVLQKWLAERNALKASANDHVYPTSAGTSGSQLYEWMTGAQLSTAGPAVNERTAMAVGAVYACVGLIAGAIASLPFHIYNRTDAGRERANNHPLWWMFNEQPCTCMSAAVMWEYLVWSLLLHGDSVAPIERASRLSPNIVGVEPVHPLSVTVQRIDDRLAYTIVDADKTRVLDQDDVLHVPGLGFNGLRGLSPLRYAARQAIGLALAADEYSARFFSNGARPDYVITTKAAMKPEAQTTFRETWMARYGGVQNAHIPAILSGEGVDVKKLTLSPEEAQLLATRNHQASDIARLYGVPPHMIGIQDKQTSWGSGIEQQSIGFIKYTLSRHLVKFEQEINRKCFRTARNFGEFNTAGLERGDYKSRNEGYRIALGRAGEPAWMRPSEVRKLENLPPDEELDRLAVETNLKGAPDASPAQTAG